VGACNLLSLPPHTIIASGCNANGSEIAGVNA
jgi:hypothetical protein